jgi:hypothetical protein
VKKHKRVDSWNNLYSRIHVCYKLIKRALLKSWGLLNIMVALTYMALNILDDFTLKCYITYFASI